MLKMMIQLNIEKILQEKKYKLSDITQTIDQIFHQAGLSKLQGTISNLMYCDTGNARGYGRCGRVVNILKRQQWFMENVSAWILYDNEDTENPEEYNEEDLLKHYRRKQAMRA